MGKRICVRSSINIDEFFEVEHIVRSGETIASSGYSRRPGGKGANCATAIAKAGGSTDFCGTLSAQDGWLRETLQGYGVGASTETLRESSEHPTGRAIIQLSTSTADNSIVLLPGSNYADYLLPPALCETYSHLLVQNEIPLAQTSSALLAAREQGLHTIFNPSPVPARRDIASVPWDCVDWLVLNEEEAKTLLVAFGRTAPEQGEFILKQLSDVLPTAAGVVVTRGAEGVRAALRAGPREEVEMLECPAGKALGPIADTTGAGDTFTGYLAALLLQLGKEVPMRTEMQDILRIAAEAGTACCEKKGAMEAIPSLAEVKQRYQVAERSWPSL